MKREYARLEKIEHDHPITKETDEEFLYHLQNALLLDLKERGILNMMQYRHAAERLREQRRAQRLQKGSRL